MMNRYIKNIGIAAASLLVIGTGSGCKKFLDVNTNPNGPNAVQEALLLSYVELNGAYTITGGYPARTAALWTQQIAYNQPAPEWDTYKVLPSDLDNTWNFDMYPGVLKNLTLIEAAATEKKHDHYAAIAKILLAYNLAVSTDMWNAIPYTDAFKGADVQPKPSYDTQEQIYTTIGQLLDDGIALASTDGGPVEPGEDDFIYKGNMSSWTKFAYMLKARYALRLTYAPGHDAKTQAQAALDALTNGFESAADNAKLIFDSKSGSQNPWWQLLNYWGSIVTSSTFVDLLQSTNDPRLPAVAKPNDNDDAYVGRVIGSDPDGAGKISDLGDALTQDNDPVYFATYDEALFIKAEANYLISGVAAAQPVLIDAVKENMTRLGVDPTSAAATTYLTTNVTLTPANAYNVIMTQKYISNYLSLESWNDWRRTGLPVLHVVQHPYLNLTEIPRRLPYGATEMQSNPRPEQQVTLTDHVWWDAKP